jgi:hypothetical protein
MISVHISISPQQTITARPDFIPLGLAVKFLEI